MFIGTFLGVLSLSGVQAVVVEFENCLRRMLYTSEEACIYV